MASAAGPSLPPCGVSQFSQHRSSARKISSHLEPLNISGGCLFLWPTRGKYAPASGAERANCSDAKKSVACSTAAVAVGLPEKMLQLTVVSFDEVVAWE